MMKVAVIGAGAAGCFFAAELKRRLPDVQLTVYEAGRRPMLKLALTGGGRCNITNSFGQVENLARVYPRGERFMKRALRRFGPLDLLRWFGAEGVRFVTQPDGCVFPESQDAMQIVRTLERLMRSRGAELVCGRRCLRISPSEGGSRPGGFSLEFADGGTERADKVLLAAGGSSSAFLRTLLPPSVEVVPTVPSLFTFRIDDDGLRALTGTVVEHAALSLEGTSFRSEGILLLTDWGVSGPATLKLSSYAARYLSEHSYEAALLVNWTGRGEAQTRELLAASCSANPARQLSGVHPEGLSTRLWRQLLLRAGVRPELRCSELGTRSANRLVNVLCSDRYGICGRAAFKEEFVTCGGVALSSVNLGTLESRGQPGLYFAGEVLDIDAVTGGFNLQAAWSCAYIAAEALAAAVLEGK